LSSNDSLVCVKETKGNEHILLLSRKGKSIRFPETNVRPMGRATTGVRGIKLEPNDEVIGMEVFAEKTAKPKDKRRKIFRDILTISEKGLGKRTGIHLFPKEGQGRGSRQQ